MSYRPALVLCMTVLAACGTPQQQCITANTRDLQVLERLIAETERDIARGYAEEEVRVPVPQWVPCGPKPVSPAPGVSAPPQQMCFDTFDQIQTRPKAINLDAERAKLATMQKKRVELARAAQKVVADCKARFPE